MTFIFKGTSLNIQHVILFNNNKRRHKNKTTFKSYLNKELNSNNVYKLSRLDELVFIVAKRALVRPWRRIRVKHSVTTLPPQANYAPPETSKNTNKLFAAGRKQKQIGDSLRVQ